MRRFQHAAVVTAALVLMAAPPAWGQNLPWESFSDDPTISASLCDLVNAANAELVVMRGTGQLVIVTGNDIAIEGSLVDAQGDVFIGQQPVGFLSFAEDGDGFRTLWWLSLTGRAIDINGLTGEVTESDLSPIDFTDVPCSACEFWDDQSVCRQPDPSNIILNLCGLGSANAMLLTLVGLTGMRVARRRWR
jgi:hypothetical protein